MAILNSEICWWYLSNTGTVLANGYSRYKPGYLKAFPMPIISNEVDREIQSILLKKGGDADALKYLICSLYNLTEEEIAMIYEAPN